jgi:hypothetical protein
MSRTFRIVTTLTVNENGISDIVEIKRDIESGKIQREMRRDKNLSKVTMTIQEV